ncbi:MAG TPA: XdhC family protein [Ktedonobacteraceae bacterium]|nr:XdhC family protein [Ktedonobacteraceae bacterium]
MTQSLLELAVQLEQAGRSFVLATVVWCERPVSAKPGAQALIQEDGQITGWVGGSCTQPVVLREARRILQEGGEPLLLRLGTAVQSDSHTQPGVLSFPMTCASGGALDIYMEPHLPQPQLLLIGDSPIIAALKQLAPVLDFAVNSIDDSNVPSANITRRTFIVIATHGQYDENVLEQVLESPAAYIGMVSSTRRAAACRAYLREVGLAEQHIARLKAPAGLAIGALTPAEIATSILAELVQLRRQAVPYASADEEKSSTHVTDIVQAEPTTALDPVCGMTVEIAHTRHTSAYQGRTFYFCCPACKREFEREPERFLVGRER